MQEKPSPHARSPYAPLTQHTSSTSQKTSHPADRLASRLWLAPLFSKSCSLALELKDLLNPRSLAVRRAKDAQQVGGRRAR